MGISERWEKKDGKKKRRGRSPSSSGSESGSPSSKSPSPAPKRSKRSKRSKVVVEERSAKRSSKKNMDVESSGEEAAPVSPKKEVKRSKAKKSSTPVRKGRGFANKGRNFGERSRSRERPGSGDRPRRTDNWTDADRPPSPDRRPQDFQVKKVYSRRNTSRKFYGLAQSGANATSSNFTRGPARRSRSRSRSRERGRERERGDPTKRLFVGRLSFDTTKSSLADAFSEWSVNDCFIPNNDEGLSKGFGFVNFDTVEDATAAMEKLDGTEIDGRQIAIEYAKERERPFRGGGGGGFRGGGGRDFGGSFGGGLDRMNARRERFGSSGGSSSFGGGGGGRSRDGGGGRRDGGRGGGGGGGSFGGDGGRWQKKDLDDDLDAYFNQK